MKISGNIQEDALKFGDRVVVVSECKSTGQAGTVTAFLNYNYVLVELDCGDTKSYYRTSLSTQDVPSKVNTNNKSMEDNKMKKELQCNKVAQVQTSSGRLFFALYDEDIVPGDRVAVTGLLADKLHRVVDVLTTDEAKITYSGPITEEVIGRLDDSAYQVRLENRAKKAEIRKKMDNEIKNMTENQFYERYAQVNPEIAAMLEEYNKLK